MQKIIKLVGNTVVVEDFLTGDLEETIALHDFSYEFYQDSVQLVDSNKTEKVYSVLFANVLDDTGAPLGNAETILTYLSSFTAPAGTVTLDPGGQVEVVDNVGNKMSIANNEGNEVTKGFIFMGEDENGFMHRVRTTSDGRLVSTAQVTNPPGSTGISQIDVGNVTSMVDLDYIIPNTETIIIQELSAGAEGDVDGSKVELWAYEDALKTIGELLGVLYVNGSNSTVSINTDFTGNGIRLITLRRARLAGAQKEIFGKWQGYKY